MLKSNQSHKTNQDLPRGKPRKVNEDLPRGKYQHYSGKTYQVIGLAKFSENSARELETMVVYQSLEDSKGFPKGTLWVRSLAEFIDKVELNGKLIPRFIKIEGQLDY